MAGSRSFDCLNAYVQWILQQKGQNIKGSDIFFNGGGYVLWHKKGNMHLHSNAYEANFRYLELSNIKYSHKYLSDLHMHDFMLQQLAKEYYVLAKVDTSILKYDSFYQGIDNTIHYILLEDVAREQVRVRDLFVPSNEPYAKFGEIDYHMLLSSWKNNKYEVVMINKSECNCSICLDTEGAFRRGGHKYLTAQKCRVCIDAMDSYDNYTFGYLAVEGFIDEYASLISEKTPTVYGLTIAFVRQIRWGGYLGCLKYIEHYLDGDDRFKKVINTYSLMVKKWDHFLLLLIRNALKRNYTAIEELCNQMRENIKIECGLLYDILRVYDI